MRLASRAFSLADWRAKTERVAMIAIIAMTTRSSMRVKAFIFLSAFQRFLNIIFILGVI
jgi:hypothetical protein